MRLETTLGDKEEVGMTSHEELSLKEQAALKKCGGLSVGKKSGGISKI